MAARLAAGTAFESDAAEPIAQMTSVVFAGSAATEDASAPAHDRAPIILVSRGLSSACSPLVLNASSSTQ